MNGILCEGLGDEFDFTAVSHYKFGMQVSKPNYNCFDLTKS
jgi:hypothetical protein